jgi:uncharacterized protein (TIGR00255 family)
MSCRKSGVVHVNQAVLKKYIAAINQIKARYGLREQPGLNTILHLPGVLSLEEQGASKLNIWPLVKTALERALGELVKTRQKEGAALVFALSRQLEAMQDRLSSIKKRFQQAVKAKLELLATDEERAAFLKETDITEEADRLHFHIRNFRSKLKKSAAVGKELDFIAQEMQREANTLSAKTFDPGVSAAAVQLKSAVEKIREQVQNIE